MPEKKEAAFSPGRVDSEVPAAPKPPYLLSRMGGHVHRERGLLALQRHLKEQLVWGDLGWPEASEWVGLVLRKESKAGDPV